MSKSDKFELIGLCTLCKNKYKKAGIRRHLTKCMKSLIEPQEVREGTNIFHIVIEERYAPYWWLHIAINSDLELEDIDNFLRGIWLECCGHLSAFQINNEYYNRSSTGDIFGEYNEDKSMEYNLDELLKVGMNLNYTYDWGTSTLLKLNVISETPGSLDEGIILLARNEIPNFPCSYCNEKRAEFICSVCMGNSDDWLFCKSCRKKHDCDEEYYLPYVNSPRTGHCAYEGRLSLD